MDKVENNDFITIDYSARFIDGQTILESKKDQPLRFQVGNFSVVQGFNSAVIGMQSGQTKKLSMYPSNAFGSFDSNLIKTVNLKELPRFILVGKRVSMNKNREYSTILEVNTEAGTALIDGNHFLAGYILEFSISILDIKKGRRNQKENNI